MSSRQEMMALEALNPSHFNTFRDFLLDTDEKSIKLLRESLQRSAHCSKKDLEGQRKQERTRRDRARACLLAWFGATDEKVIANTEDAPEEAVRKAKFKIRVSQLDFETVLLHGPFFDEHEITSIPDRSWAIWRQVLLCTKKPIPPPSFLNILLRSATFNYPPAKEALNTAFQALLESEGENADYKRRVEEEEARLNTEFEERLKEIEILDTEDRRNKTAAVVLEYEKQHVDTITQLKAEFGSALGEAALHDAAANARKYKMPAEELNLAFRKQFEAIARLKIPFTERLEESALALTEYNRMFEELSISPPISSEPEVAFQIYASSPTSNFALSTNLLQSLNEHNIDPTLSNNPRPIGQSASIFTPGTQFPGDLQVAIHQGGRGVKRPWDEDALSQPTTQGTQSLNTGGIPLAQQAVYNIDPSLILETYPTNLLQNPKKYNVDSSSNTIPWLDNGQIIMPDTLLSATPQIDGTNSHATVSLGTYSQAGTTDIHSRLLTRPDYDSLKFIQKAKYWPGLVSNNLINTLSSLDIIRNREEQPLWTMLPEVSRETTQSEAQLTMHLTRAVQSSQIKDVYVNRGSLQANAENNLSATTAADKREWAELCLSQLGDQDVALPVYKITRCDLLSAESVQPLTGWTQKKLALYKQPENGTSVMVTPSGAYSDIHVDATTIGRAVCVDRCTKVWLVWPPTDKNLKLWADNKGLGVAIQVYGAELEGGIIIRTSGNKSEMNAITLPAGTLHCVFTVFGGFLTGTNYSTAEDIPLAAKMLEVQVKRGQYQDQIEQDCSWLTKTVEMVLNAQPVYATSALTAVAWLLNHIDGHERSQDDGWKKFTASAPHLFREYRRTLGASKICSCGRALPESIREMRRHFLRVDH